MPETASIQRRAGCSHKDRLGLATLQQNFRFSGFGDHLTRKIIMWVAQTGSPIQSQIFNVSAHPFWLPHLSPSPTKTGFLRSPTDGNH